MVFFTLILVTGNTMAISVRERTGELAVFKAIGYSDLFVLFFVLAEALLIAIIGAAIGVVLSLMLIPALGKALSGLLPSIVLSPGMLVFGVGIAVFTGLLSGLLPGIGAMQLRVVNALRRV